MLAVANARVASVVNGLPENAGSNPESGRAITLENATGNTIILDLGHGRYALYAHLQPGSLRVQAGDLVKTGQVLAKLGNSGNSDAPHLHFRLMDAPSGLGSEGVPYTLASFTQAGVLDDPDALYAGKPWQPKSKSARVLHRGEFPADVAVVSFP